MEIVANQELLQELGEPREGHEWLADVDSPDAVMFAQAIKGTFRKSAE